MDRFSICLAAVFLIGCGSDGDNNPEAGTLLSINSPDGGAADGAKGDLETAGALVQRSQELIRQGQLNQAIESLSRAIGLQPDNADALRIRAEVYSAMGENANALADFSSALRLNPNDARLLNLRGFFLMSRNQADRAVKDFSKAVEVDPKFAPAFNNRGLVHLSAGRLEQAVQDFSGAIEVDAKYADAWNNRGFAWYRQKKFDKAISDLNRALAINKDGRQRAEQPGSGVHGSERIRPGGRCVQRSNCPQPVRREVSSKPASGVFEARKVSRSASRRRAD